MDRVLGRNALREWITSTGTGSYSVLVSYVYVVSGTNGKLMATCRMFVLVKYSLGILVPSHRNTTLP